MGSFIIVVVVIMIAIVIITLLLNHPSVVENVRMWAIAGRILVAYDFKLGRLTLSHRKWIAISC